MTKIDIISGFLGAGKTTLLKKLVKEAYQKEQIVIIENEFGEVGIDGGFLKEAGITVTEMNSGCICCTLVGDFATALNEVLETYHPQRIIIEPSGVGKLSDVIKAVQGILCETVVLSSYTTVVDVKKCKMYSKNFGEFFNNQIESAKTIVCSRTEEVTEDKLAATIALIREHNKVAEIVTTPWGDIKGEQIKQVMEQGNNMLTELIEQEGCPHCGHNHDHGSNHEHEHGNEHEHHHHATDVFASFGAETTHKYEEEGLKNILEELSNAENLGIILRAKGIVSSVSGEWFHFDLVPGEYEIRRGASDYTGRICVIGSQLDSIAIGQLFETRSAKE